MASWDNPASASASTSTPHVKFEDSPAESFLSTPGDMYPSLFDTPSVADTADPMENVMTPGSSHEPSTSDRELSGTPAPESSDKKPSKKRKSWGQVLPEPKTNLPPRKRAKTEDEKEQRRVERVLRNRRAAQSSRERKRQEVELLEKRNKDLEEQLRLQREQTNMLLDELNKFRRGSSAARGSSPLEMLNQPSPITLSKPLFQSQENGPSMVNDFVFKSEPQDDTVNPASLSPELSPISEAAPPVASATFAPAKPSTSATTTTDVTQHPAVSVGGSAADVDGLPEVATSAGALLAVPVGADGMFHDAVGFSEPTEADGWGAQAPFSPGSDPLNFEYNHLDGDFTGGSADFDFNNYIVDDVSGAASGAIAGHVSIGQEPDFPCHLFDFENQVPSAALNQQPHTGASSTGCDDGVLAVGN